MFNALVIVNEVIERRNARENADLVVLDSFDKFFYLPRVRDKDLLRPEENPPIHAHGLRVNVVQGKGGKHDFLAILEGVTRPHS